MTADEILLDTEERMEKAVDVLKHALAGIRTGRANPGLVDSLRVEVYGSPDADQGNRLGRRPEPTQIVIRPFDPGTIKDIEKAIQASGLGFNPQSDGRVIRINVPPLSTDVRRKLVGPHQGADRRGQGRRPQRPPRRQQGGRPGGKGQGADRRRAKPAKEEIQELTKKYEAKINDLAKAKETEVMEN